MLDHFEDENHIGLCGVISFGILQCRQVFISKFYLEERIKIFCTSQIPEYRRVGVSLEIDFLQKQPLRFHIHWVRITVEGNGQWIIFDQPMLCLETLQCQPAVQAT